MSNLTYYNYPGVGERYRESYYYSQACRVGDKIECAGQGAGTTQRYNTLNSNDSKQSNARCRG